MSVLGNGTELAPGVPLFALNATPGQGQTLTSPVYIDPFPTNPNVSAIKGGSGNTNTGSLNIGATEAGVFGLTLFNTATNANLPIVLAGNGTTAPSSTTVSNQQVYQGAPQLLAAGGILQYVVPGSLRGAGAIASGIYAVKVVMTGAQAPFLNQGGSGVLSWNGVSQQWDSAYAFPLTIGYDHANGAYVPSPVAGSGASTVFIQDGTGSVSGALTITMTFTQLTGNTSVPAT